MNLPEEVKNIIHTLEQNGFEAYVVGGCVRDYLLGKTPHDYDITTNAKPEDVKRIFVKTIDTGLKHGTVSVKGKNDIYEITTFRIDGDYSDGRHPDSVQFTNLLKNDLARRDLTINAIAYSPKTGFVDPFEGQKDIKNKIIRTVGNPEDRFNEDALRMMRVIRFSCQLGFEVEKATYDAIKKLKDTINKVSKERIQAELTKSILGKWNFNFDYFYSTGLLYKIHKDFEKLKNFRIILQHLDITIGVPEDILNEEYVYPILFMLEDKNIVNAILRDLKFSNNVINKVIMGIELINDIQEAYKQKREDLDILVKELLNKFKAEDIFTFQNEIPLFQMITFLNQLIPNDLAKYYNEVWTTLESIRYLKHPICMKDLAINGNDLQTIDIKGKDIGKILNLLLKDVWKEPTLNEKAKLMELSKHFKATLFINKIVNS